MNLFSLQALEFCNSCCKSVSKKLRHWNLFNIVKFLSGVNNEGEKVSNCLEWSTREQWSSDSWASALQSSSAAALYWFVKAHISLEDRYIVQFKPLCYKGIQKEYCLDIFFSCFHSFTLNFLPYLVKNEEKPDY